MGHGYRLDRDSAWAAADAVATLALLGILIAKPSVLWWLLMWAWAALTYRQVRLAVRARRESGEATVLRH